MAQEGPFLDNYGGYYGLRRNLDFIPDYYKQNPQILKDKVFFELLNTVGRTYSYLQAGGGWNPYDDSATFTFGNGPNDPPEQVARAVNLAQTSWRFIMGQINQLFGGRAPVPVPPNSPGSFAAASGPTSFAQLAPVPRPVQPTPIYTPPQFIAAPSPIPISSGFLQPVVVQPFVPTPAQIAPPVVVSEALPTIETGPAVRPILAPAPVEPSISPVVRGFTMYEAEIDISGVGWFPGKPINERFLLGTDVFHVPAIAGKPAVANAAIVVVESFTPSIYEIEDDGFAQQDGTLGGKELVDKDGKGGRGVIETTPADAIESEGVKQAFFGTAAWIAYFPKVECELDFIDLVNTTCKIVFEVPGKGAVEGVCDPVATSGSPIPETDRLPSKIDGWRVDGPTSATDPTWLDEHRFPVDYDEKGAAGSRLKKLPKGAKGEGQAKQDIPGHKSLCGLARLSGGTPADQYDGVLKKLKDGGKSDEEARKDLDDQGFKREPDNIKGWTEATITIHQRFQAWVVCVNADKSLTVIAMFGYEQTLTATCTNDGKAKGEPKREFKLDEKHPLKEGDDVPKEDKKRLKDLVEKDKFGTKIN